MKKGFSLFLLSGLLVVSSSLWAADNSADSGGVLPTDEVRESVGLILLGGLAGGVLGLSTLSFYDQPQEHLRNITYGAGFGVIGMSLYVAFNVAKTSRYSAQTDPAAQSWSVLPYLQPEHSGLAFNLLMK